MLLQQKKTHFYSVYFVEVSYDTASTQNEVRQDYDELRKETWVEEVSKF